MSLETGKLYLTSERTSNKTGEPVLLELKGNVSINILGSQDLPDTLADCTPQITDLLTDDMEYTLTGLPRYVVFVGTADKINVEGGRVLTFVKDIS